jgi:hypothetical protein
MAASPRLFLGGSLDRDATSLQGEVRLIDVVDGDDDFQPGIGHELTLLDPQMKAATTSDPQVTALVHQDLETEDVGEETAGGGEIGGQHENVTEPAGQHELLSLPGD